MRTSTTKNGYTFTPHDEHRCIFVHIPKTAGISLNRSLFGCLGSGHPDIAQYQVIYSREDFEAYFKFAFIRNPWDRLFSAYRFLARGGMTEMDARWSREFLSCYSGFDDFVLRGFSRKTIWSYVHFVPQYEFLCLPKNKEILADFVGLYENLQADFEHVRKRLGLSASVVLRQDNAASSIPCDYREAYTDRMKEIVAEVYREDIELLGYDFETTSLDTIYGRVPRA